MPRIRSLIRSTFRVLPGRRPAGRLRTARARASIAALTALALIVPASLAASSAAAAGSVSVVADFESGTPTGFFAYGNAGFGIADVAPGSADARPGQTQPTKVLSYGFDVAPAGSFGGVGHNFGSAATWVAFEGVRFWMRGSGNGAALQFEIFDGGANADSSERFDTTIVDTIAGWREITLPWSAFARASDFQPGGAPSDGLNLATVWGYAVPAAAGSDTVLIDDIAVYSSTAITPTVGLSATAIETIEGDVVDLTVRLNVASETEVAVNVATTEGTAVSPADFLAVETTVTFPAGSTAQKVQITTVDDGNEEASKTFTVALSSSVGATIGTPASTVVTIVDNDGVITGPPAGRQLLIEDFESPLQAGADGAVAVGWFAAQDSASTVGFAVTDTKPQPAPGESLGNTVLETRFNVQAFGVVLDNFTNDTATVWTPQDWSTYVGVGFWMYGNGSGTTLFFDLEDNRNPGSTTDDAERFSAEFVDSWRGWKFIQLDFADLARKNINNGAPNDGLNLTDVHGFAIGALRTPTPQTYYVDDLLLYGTAPPVPLTVGFDRAGYTVTEGVDAVATVRLNRVSESDVRVRYTTGEEPARTATEDLPATEARDFVRGSGVLTIPAGERQASVSIPTIQNAKHEVDETFVVSLSNFVGAAAGFVTTATVSIDDDDASLPSLVDDFESYPWLFNTTGDIDLDVREVSAGTRRAHPRSDQFENVVDVDYGRKTSTLTRDFALGQDWSASRALGFWYRGSGDRDRVTVTLADNDAPTPAPSQWVEAWGDEFTGAAGSRPNPENWTFETGGWGWGNDELQYYIDSKDNASLDGEGNLAITARKIDPATTDLECWYGPCTHTSARLITEQKQEFAYGRVDTRVKVPVGSGIWPAVWSLGNDFREVGWPQTGEIDFMESVGRLPNEVFGTIHGPGYSGGQSFGGILDIGEPVADDWHVFTVQWSPEKIDWFVDGIQYHSATPADVAPNPWVFEHPFSLITNVAVGGNFGGAPGANLVFPQSLLVDYIRVYQPRDTAERFEASFVDKKAGWRWVTIPFSDLKRSRIQPAGAPRDGLTLTDVQGYGFAFAGTGRVSIDQVTLLARRHR